MEKVGLIQRFRISVLDVHSYKKIMKDSLAKAILFLLLITFIFDVIPLIINIGTINSEKEKIIEAIKNDNISMAVKDSQLVAPEKVINIEMNGSLIYMNKDASYEQAKEGELNKLDTFVGILKDEIVIETNGITQRLPYSQLEEFSFSTEELISYINIMVVMVFGFVLVFIMVSSFIGYLIKGVILASVASITSMFKKKIIRFGELYKCGLYSLALPIIFCSILKLLRLPINWAYFYYIQIIAGGIYAALAVVSYEDDNNEQLIQQ